ncbi:isoprenylcysteine carboxylmethyltransferase family protein [Anatilimnocola sp. NA78]|uniref:methyltransferase family protein n=1 Tax=Anatilimnocola sp. NA78 TaxID=3415683 RepID=UPI003CE4FCAC
MDATSIESQRIADPVSASRSFIRRSRAWISLLLLAPATLLAIFSRPHFTGETLAETGVEVFAWLLFLAGGSLRWWSTLYIGGRKTNNSLINGHALVVDGPYSVCRNPLYLGTLLLCLSVGVFTQSLILIGAMFLVTLIYLRITVPVEEERLASVFGEEYREYLRRVPRLIPNFSLYHSPREVTVRMNGLRAEFLRMLQWGSIPALWYLLEHLRLLSWWPTPFNLP